MVEEDFDDAFSSFLKLYYFDTSALIKRYKLEKGTDIIDKIFKESNLRYTSYIAIGEVFNVLKNRGTKKAIYRLEADIADGLIRLISPIKNDQVNMRAIIQNIRILEDKYKVEPTDALHFLIMEKELVMFVDSFFVCSDKNLCNLVRDKGFQVINPEGNSNMAGVGKNI